MIELFFLSVIANEPAAAQQRDWDRGSIQVAGQDTKVCIYSGTWPDGSVLYYQAWDECSRLRVRRVRRSEVDGAPSLGTENHYSVTDIPSGAAIIEIGNEYSTVIIFPDTQGITREILISD